MVEECMINKFMDDSEKYRIIAENSSDLIRLIDTNGIIQYASPSHETLLGYDHEKLIGNYFYRNIHPEDCTGIIEKFEEMVKDPKATKMEYRKRHSDGHYIYIEAICSPVCDEENRLRHFISVARDISERIAYEKKLKELAYIDPLTGAGNRRVLQKLLINAIEDAKENGHMFAVFMMDFDRFKWVNDTMGHDAGDELLKQFVNRAKAELRPSDQLCRMGGDEFTIILTPVYKIEDITHTAERLLHQLRTPWSIDGFRFITTSSIGISIFPNDGEDGHTLLKHADHALYRAKRKGRNIYKFYTPKKNKKMKKLLLLENQA